MVLEKVVSILNARLRSMLFLVKWLDNRVASFTLHVMRLGCILALYLMIHLNQVLLSLLLLVLFHELFEHLFSSLLAFLSDVFLDKLVDRVDLLLLVAM